MADYFNVKNEPILNPPSGVSLGNLNNQYQTIYASGNLVINNSTFTATALVVPKISTIGYPGNDTAADTAGGQTLTLTGSGFAAGASVVINGVSASVVTVVSSTIITFTAPALAAGSYVVYVINPDGGTAILLPGIQYSGTPSWSTAAGTLGTLYETTAINSTVTATGDAPVSYSLQSGTLPPGASLNSNGTISGTSSATASPTTYTFTIRATDGQNQDTDRQFSMTINPDVVTWDSPPAGNVYAVAADSAISNVALSATSAIGYGIQYTANTLPTGLTLSGNIISGTPTVGGTTNTLLTATANTSSRSATRTISWVISVVPTYWLYRMRMTSDTYNGIDYQRGVAVDSNNNVIHLSTILSGQALVAKIDSSGSTIQWQKTLGANPTGDGVGITIIPSEYNRGFIDSSGSFYHAGQSKRAGDGIRYGYVSKISSAGNLEWTQYLGLNTGNASKSGSFINVSQDTTGNVIASGGLYVDANYAQSGMVAKYDSSGNLLWQKRVQNLYYGYIDASAPFYSTTSKCQSCVDSSNSIILSTDTYPTTGNVYPDITRAHVMKLDSSGNLQWSRRYNPPATASFTTVAHDLATDTSNNIYAVFGDTSASTLYGTLVIKVDGTNGSILWQRNIYVGYSVYGPNYIRARKVLFANGFVYVAGYGFYQMQGGQDTPSNLWNSYPRRSWWIVKLNTSGTVIWQRRIKPSSWDTQTLYDTVGLAWQDNTVYLQFNAPQVQGNGGTDYYDTNIGILKVPDDGSKTGTYTLAGSSFIYEASSYTIEAQPDSLVSDGGSSASGFIVQTSTYENGSISPTVSNASFASAKVTI